MKCIPNTFLDKLCIINIYEDLSSKISHHWCLGFSLCLLNAVPVVEYWSPTGNVIPCFSLVKEHDTDYLESGMRQQITQKASRMFPQAGETGMGSELRMLSPLGPGKTWFVCVLCTNWLGSSDVCEAKASLSLYQSDDSGH